MVTTSGICNNDLLTFNSLSIAENTLLRQNTGRTFCGRCVDFEEHTATTTTRLYGGSVRDSKAHTITLPTALPSMDGDNSFLHLARPLAPIQIGAQPSTAPLAVSIQPQAILAILDHSLRRPDDQERVIGTLLGVRSEDGTEVEIKNCYAVPHTETAEQVEVDMDYQKAMLALHLRANPKEVLIGWYATSSELNTFSALIQNFYGQQGDGTFPHPAVHLTVSTARVRRSRPTHTSRRPLA